MIFFLVGGKGVKHFHFQDENKIKYFDLENSINQYKVVAALTIFYLLYIMSKYHASCTVIVGMARNNAKLIKVK